METNAFFQLFVAVACMMCVGCTGKRKAQSDVALVKETPPAVQSPEVTDENLRLNNALNTLLFLLGEQGNRILLYSV